MSNACITEVGANGVARFGIGIAVLVLLVVGCEIPKPQEVPPPPDPPLPRLLRCVQTTEHTPCALYGASVIELVAKPDLFDGKSVRMVGYLSIEFEDEAVYASKEDYEWFTGNRITLMLSREEAAALKPFDQSYVFLTATYHALTTVDSVGRLDEVNDVHRVRSRSELRRGQVVRLPPTK